MVVPIVPAFGMTGGAVSCCVYFGIVVGSSVPPGTWAIAIVTLATISASADDTERVRFHQVPLMIFSLFLFRCVLKRLTSVSFSPSRPVSGQGLGSNIVRSFTKNLDLSSPPGKAVSPGYGRRKIPVVAR